MIDLLAPKNTKNISLWDKGAPLVIAGEPLEPEFDANTTGSSGVSDAEPEI